MARLLGSLKPFGKSCQEKGNQKQLSIIHKEKMPLSRIKIQLLTNEKGRYRFHLNLTQPCSIILLHQYPRKSTVNKEAQNTHQQPKLQTLNSPNKHGFPKPLSIWISSLNQHKTFDHIITYQASPEKPPKRE